MAELIFICGACGVGKSSLIPHFRKLFSIHQILVSDFDTSALPGDRDDAWILQMTRGWASRAVGPARNGIASLVCGPSYLENRIVRNVESEYNININLFFLDAEPETIRKRLSDRIFIHEKRDPNEMIVGSQLTASQWIDRCVRHSNYMRRNALIDGYTIIPGDVYTSNTIARLISSKLNKKSRVSR